MRAKRHSAAQRPGSRKRSQIRASARPGSAPRQNFGVLQTEEALRRSEERFRLLVDKVRDYAIFMLDPDGVIVSWNEGAKRIKGYRAEEIIGQSMSRFYTAEDVEHHHPQRLLSLAEREGRVEEEGWRVRKDGRLFWADVIITALRDDQGRLRGFAKVTRDLTERKRAEDALRESQQQLRAVFDHSPSIMFIKDKEGRYLECNPPFEILCGRKRDQILGRTDAELMPPEQAAEYTSHDQEVLKEGAVKRFEETAVYPEGARSSLVAKFPLRDALGHLYAVGGIVTDITDRKRAEESMRQLAGRLFQLQDEEQERLARELQGGVAQALDKIRSQLISVKESGTVFDWKTSDLLDQTIGLARDAMKEVRTLSRMLYPRLLDEAGLVEALRWFASSFSERAGIEVVVDVSAGFGRLSREAERGMFRIVQESLTNVEQHSGSKTARIRLTRDEQAVRLEVIDEGKGMPPGILHESSGTVAIPGVGIRGMVERMRHLKGRLEMDSGSGGTTVRAILPVPQPPAG